MNGAFATGTRLEHHQKSHVGTRTGKSNPTRGKFITAHQGPDVPFLVQPANAYFRNADLDVAAAAGTGARGHALAK